MSHEAASGRNGAYNQGKYALGLYRIAEQWPGLRYLGLGAWWAWIWVCYNGTGLMSLQAAGTQADHVGMMYLLSTPAVAVMLVCAAVFWRRATHLIDRGAPVVALSVLGSAGTLMIGYSAFLGGDTVFAIGAVLTGIGTSVLCLATGRTYGNANIRETLTAGSVSLVVSALLYYMAMGIPHDWLIPFAAVLPIVSAFLYIMPSGDPYPGDPDAPVVESLGRRAPGRRSFRRLVLASALVAVTSGVGKGIASVSNETAFQTMGSTTTFFIFLIAIAIFFYVNVGDVVRAVKRIYSALMLLGVAVLFLSCFGLNIGFMTVGKEVLWMLFTCLMAYIVFRFDFSPVRAFGIGQVFYFIASTAAWAIGRSLATFQSESTIMIFAVAMAFVIMLVFAVIFTDSDLTFILTWKPAHEHIAVTGSARDGQGANVPDAMGAASLGEGFSTAPDSEASRVQEPVANNGGAQAAAVESGSILTPEQSTDQPAANSAHSDVTDDTPAAGAPDASATALTLHDRIERLDPALGVSAREKEIMELFAEGRSANWIAEELTISKNTVRSHIRNIHVKLDVHSRQELIDYLNQIR